MITKLVDPTIKELSDMIMDLAREKGFGTSTRGINTLEKIALIYSEVSEAMEAYRRKNINGKDGLAEELADAIIRIIHLAGAHKINLSKVILKKIAINKNRIWDWKKFNESHI